MSDRPRRTKRIVIIAAVTAGVIGVTLGGAAFAVQAHYSDRALPGTTVAGVDVAGMDRQAIIDAIDAKVSELKVSFGYGDSSTAASAEQAGLTVDTAAAADAAIDAKRDLGLFDRLDSDQGSDITPAGATNADALQEYLDTVFADLVIAPVNAVVVANPEAQSFETQPGVDGQRIDASAITDQVTAIAATLDQATIPVAVQPVTPEVTTPDAQAVADHLNTVLDTAFTLTVPGAEEPVATLDRATICSWLSIAADGITPQVDAAAIAAFVTDTIAPEVHRDPVNEVRVVNKAGEFVRYQKQGKVGYDLADPAALGTAVAESLTTGAATDIAVNLTEVAFESSTVVDPEKWIVVNLSKQTATLYEDDTVIASYSISSGKAATPTPTGTFYVRTHVKEQTMRGGSKEDGTWYETPNVKWVTYFNGGIAFHATYWHSNFGHPMSHGCINMTTSAAKFVYDWAPNGTKVVVK